MKHIQNYLGVSILLDQAGKLGEHYKKSILYIKSNLNIW